MALTDDLSDHFFIELKQVSARLGCQPRDLLAVMASEGGVRADAHNPSSDASGLIQFMPRTLAGLGWTAGHQAFRLMTAEQQLPWVEKFFQPYKGKNLNSVGRVYQAVFLPASLDAGSSMDTVVCGANGPFAPAYENNRSVDTAGKGFITVRDLCDAVEQRAQGARWNEILSRLGPVAPEEDEAMVKFNAIAASFDERAFAEGEQISLNSRSEFGVPATAKSVLIEIFRAAGRIEVLHGDGHYAGQVGWGGLPYIQLRVDLDTSGNLSFKGFDGARLQRVGIVAYA